MNEQNAGLNCGGGILDAYSISLFFLRGGVMSFPIFVLLSNLYIVCFAQHKPPSSF